MAAMTRTQKRNGLYAYPNDDSVNGNVKTSPTRVNKRRQRFSPSESLPQTTFAYMFIGCIVILGSIQFLLNALLFQNIDTHNFGVPKRSLSQQIDSLQTQLRQWEQQSQIYIEDGNFYPFAIRDSRRLVPTQLPLEVHIWDYVDISSQNQQRTKKAELFHNAKREAPAICQTYDLNCYKKKIIQVFELVLQQNPNTLYFFYMESDNELCVSLAEIRRIAYQYERYFITTGIGFSGWIMQRQFVIDFLQELKDFVPPPIDAKDILSQQGPHPSEGPDPIASVMLIEKNSWTVTRKYLVSHSIQPSIGMEALTVRMPTTADVEVTSTNTTRAAAAKPKKGLDKHLPRCLEPRRSKWRISKKDHRDRFGWDYFDYDECDGEVFPCYVGQLEELLVKDMSLFNYTELDLERQKLIEKQETRQRQKLLKEQNMKLREHGGGVKGVTQHYEANKPPFAERVKALTEKAVLRHVEEFQNSNAAKTAAATEGGGQTL